MRDIEKNNDQIFQGYHFIGVLIALNIAFQLISDSTAGKLVDIGGYAVSITVLYFPLTYIISDIVTEVYGYRVARRILWLTLLASICAGLIFQFAAYMPLSNIASFQGYDPYHDVFSVVPRVLIGGWLAVFIGDIANNYLMAKMKIWLSGAHLWLRTISSTLVGQGLNTAIFYVVALYGLMPAEILLVAILVSWGFKVLVEVLLTPLTYVAVGFLKKKEAVDFYDRDTNFNPP